MRRPEMKRPILPPPVSLGVNEPLSQAADLDPTMSSGSYRAILDSRRLPRWGADGIAASSAMAHLIRRSLVLDIQHRVAPTVVHASATFAFFSPAHFIRRAPGFESTPAASCRRLRTKAASAGLDQPTVALRTGPNGT
jgi:hypothetical protein